MSYSQSSKATALILFFSDISGVPFHPLFVTLALRSGIPFFPEFELPGKDISVGQALPAYNILPQNNCVSIWPFVSNKNPSSQPDSFLSYFSFIRFSWNLPQAGTPRAAPHSLGGVLSILYVDAWRWPNPSPPDLWKHLIWKQIPLT